MTKKKKRKISIKHMFKLGIFLAFILSSFIIYDKLFYISYIEDSKNTEEQIEETEYEPLNNENVIFLNDIPEYNGNPYVLINDNRPFFDNRELTKDAFERYSFLDYLGRCGVAYANICKELMPTEPRGEIGHIKPSGWHTIKYNGLIDGNYLYNRCHLIGYQLAGENDNECNLITGTRYMNIEGMLPFENMVDDYIEETNNHVLYRVTPIFKGENLVADGVQIEGLSVEDNGKGICFNVFCYNVQPGIEIDYLTGESREK